MNFAHIKNKLFSVQSKLHHNIFIPLHFSARFLLFSLFAKLRLGKISKMAMHARDQWILNYISTSFDEILEKYRLDCNQVEYMPNAPIWLLWWTGIDDAPELVKRCISSIQACAGNHPVHILTCENYNQYIDIPDYILEKVESKRITLTHLSDYIRVKLLMTYGGLWMDATIFCSQEIPDMCFDLPLFSCKDSKNTGDYISQCKWTAFCIGAWKGNVLFRFLVDAFESYWKSNEYLICYLLIDYSIKTAYDKIPAVAQMIDNIPYNNPHLYTLYEAMSTASPASAFEHVLQNETTFYKLSWKTNFSLLTADNKESIYARFLKHTDIQP